MSEWNWSKGAILACCSLLALGLSTIMTRWNWNKGTIVSCCSLLFLYSWLSLHAACVHASIWSFTLLQDFLIWSFVAVFVSPVSVSYASYALRTACKSVVSFCKRMVVQLFSLLPCPCPEKGLITVHSPAFGGRGMFVTIAGVSTVRSNASCYRQ